MTPISDSLYCGKGFGYAFYGCSLVDARYGWSLRVETIDILKRVDWTLYRSISQGMKVQRERERERERVRGNIMVIGFRNMDLSQKWWLHSSGPALPLS